MLAVRAIARVCTNRTLLAQIQILSISISEAIRHKFFCKKMWAGLYRTKPFYISCSHHVLFYRNGRSVHVGDPFDAVVQREQV